MNIQVVWFKRDLRIEDHAPLAAAAEKGAVIPLYIVEPSLVTAPDFDQLHYTFIQESIESLSEDLTNLGAPLILRVGEAVDVFQQLYDRIHFTTIWSHIETGNHLTYERDRAVASWAADRGIGWTEMRQQGVVRGVLDRNRWQKQWEAFMTQPPAKTPKQLTAVSEIAEAPMPDAEELGIAEHLAAVPARETDLTGGSSQAHRWLTSFLDGRGADYAKAMSSPLTAYDNCSRLSPYLAWGCVSMRSVVHALRDKQAELRALKEAERKTAPMNLKALKSFDARLHWHCHFIQKLEAEPDIEFRCFNRLCDQLRTQPDDWNEEYYQAWIEGRTGYPFVDACMRALQTRGWINFRMRAMLVSFAAYDLWLDWRRIKDFLACQFIDYEPGIHYSQLQMQSGTTGINTLRMYNPTKQGYDHDPEGTFIRTWVRELRDVPDLFIHTPHNAPRPPDNYPPPMVDHDKAIARARASFKSLRNTDGFREEASRVYEKHGSRKRPSRRRTVATSETTS